MKMESPYRKRVQKVYFKYTFEYILLFSIGVPRQVELTEKAYKECLFNSEIAMVPFNALMINSYKQMTRISAVKRGLADANVKTKVHSDRVTCTPLMKDGNFI